MGPPQGLAPARGAGGRRRRRGRGRRRSAPGASGSAAGSALQSRAGRRPRASGRAGYASTRGAAARARSRRLQQPRALAGGEAPEGRREAESGEWQRVRSVIAAGDSVPGAGRSELEVDERARVPACEHDQDERARDRRCPGRRIGHGRRAAALHRLARRSRRSDQRRGPAGDQRARQAGSRRCAAAQRDEQLPLAPSIPRRREARCAEETSVDELQKKLTAPRATGTRRRACAQTATPRARLQARGGHDQRVTPWSAPQSDERPRRAVPQPAEQHGQHQVARRSRRVPAVAAERDVEVVAQPGRQARCASGARTRSSCASR